MKTNLIPQVTTKAKSVSKLRTMQVPLKNGDTALLKIDSKDFKKYACVVFNKEGKLTGGRGHYSPLGVTSDELGKVLTKLFENAKEGFDFFKEFCNAVMH